jgi:hypothetical protein
MQRQFTIELRVDFADSEKLGPLKQVLQQAARHAYATAQLISDNPKSTQIAIFSDDFFSPARRDQAARRRDPAGARPDRPETGRRQRVGRANGGAEIMAVLPPSLKLTPQQTASGRTPCR